MSNRLTFSLASLVLIFVAGFALLIPSIAEAVDPTFNGTITNIELTVGGTHQDFLPDATDPDNAGAISYAVTRKTAIGADADPTFASLGFAFDTNTRAFTSTGATLPAASLTGAMGTYVYTATDEDNETATIEFTITVNTSVTIAGTVADQTLKAGQVFELRLPTASDSTNGTILYTLAPEISDSIPGLDFAGNLRIISGTPTADSAVAEAEYTYTATTTDDGDNDTAAAERKFKIEVVIDSDPVFGPVTVSGIVGTIGTPITRVILPEATDADGDDVTHALTPDLPAGLTFDDQLFIIEGTPTAVMAETEYTWAATDADGLMTGGTAAEKKFKITINAVPVPVALSASIADMDLLVGTYFETFLPIATTGTGVTPLMYTLTPAALPDGMEFDKDSRVLKGTPTTAAAAVTYTYKVTDSATADDGTAAPTSDMDEFDITVTDPGAPVTPAALAFATDAAIPGAPFTFTAGMDIGAIAAFPEATGGTAPLTYSVVDASGNPIANGLTFTADTRILSGTPTAAMAETTYTYKVTDAATPMAEDTLDVKITVDAAGDGDPDISQPTNVEAMPQNDGSVMVTWEWEGADATEATALAGFTVEWNPTADVAADQTSYRIPAHLLTAGAKTTVSVLARATAGLGFATPAAPTAMAEPIEPVDPNALRFAPDASIGDDGDLSFTAGMPVGTTAMPYIQLPQAHGGTVDKTYSVHKGRGQVKIASSADGETGDIGNGLSVDFVNLRLTGTPDAATEVTDNIDYIWRATNVQQAGDVEDTVDLPFSITVDGPPPGANTAPVVTLPDDPDDEKTESYTFAYTVVDNNSDGTPDTVTVEHASSVKPDDSASSYTVTHDATAKMVTITQTAPTATADTPFGVITVTITATDDEGLSGSDSIDVTFDSALAVPPLAMPGAPILSAKAGDQQVALTWTTPSGPIDSYQYSMDDTRRWIAVPNSTATTKSYTVKTHADGTTALSNDQTYTFVVRAINAEHNGPASNEIAATPEAAPPTVDTTKPTVTISRASPNPINCETGSTLTFGFSEALAAGEAIAADELTVSAGWKAMADGGAIKIVPMGDGSEIGVTTVSVSVNAGAVKDRAGNANDASAEPTVFTVGPVLTIPAGGFIVVIRPEHRFSTHLRDPLYVGSPGVRGHFVDIQTWECMPDLTNFFGRSVPASGGGAIVIKEADGPMGHDPKDTLADIVKGSVGLSEIMWASDAGIAHGGIPTGGRSNIDQTREQWIELHNRSNIAVKVTLFARPTHSTEIVEVDEIDRVSNFQTNNVWNVPGQSGNSDRGIDFVSMQRGKHDNKGLAPTAAEGYAHGDWNGIHSNRWSASTISYLTRPAGLRNTGQIPAENLLYDFLGTPGRDNKPGIATPILRTNVPMNSIVFNEIANRRDQTLEWIELKNVSDAKVNLKKYQISLATAKDTDVAFYTFPDNDDIQLEAGELLLLLDTSPRDNDAHPIAVAFDRNGGNDQGLGIGADAIKYKVANFREGGLPDDGNFVLYLRNRNDRLKSREGIIDVIGWSDKLADDANHTKVWPLQVFNAPDARNKIELEKVHRRQHRIDPDEATHGDDKDEHQALRDIGYTGVGYKRHAQRIPAHGGTPGYEDIRKNENPQITTPGNLTISEVMYAQGDGEYPQWIEIYNSSETEAVNLHAGDHGWRLIIENFDDGEIPVNRLSGTLNFRTSDVQTILPQQTVMIASTRARNSGSAFFDTRVVFPATRVFSVWDDARGEFDMKRSTDPILSETGFYIELIDGKNNFVDGVGNLVKSPNRRAAQDIEWALTAVTGEMMDDMGRSSILRSYREYKDGKLVGPYTAAQVEDMGVEAAGWIAAHKTDFRDVRQTWFGHPDDIGSPGITGGRVLPVSLSKFRPERLESGAIVIRWITESETNNAGFNILRSETKDGEFKQINTKLIAGHGTTSERNTYTHTDTSAKPNVVYYYQIQDVSLDGKVQTLRMSRLKGHISPAGKATTTWGELKALQ